MSHLVCYCFGYTDEDIIKDFIANRKSTVLARITQAKRTDSCQCDVKNPWKR
jgi:hypothetical protein